jgi:hypothetical protein
LNFAGREDEMLDRLVRVIVAIVALAGASTMYAAQVSDMAPCAPNAAQETSTLDSFLIVHVVCSDVLLEIPALMLGRSFTPLDKATGSHTAIFVAFLMP